MPNKPPDSLPISVNLIVKNCASDLKVCLDSLKSFIRPCDEVVILDTGSTDNTMDVAKSCGANVFQDKTLQKGGMLDYVKDKLPDHYKRCSEDPQFKDGFLSSFAEARKRALSYCRHDIIFWLDSDDELTGGENLRNLCNDVFKEPNNNVILMQYDYSFEKDGTCNTVLWRERVFRKNDYKWKGACHEVLIPNPTIEITGTRCPAEVSKLLHRNDRHHIYADIRNYVILRNEYDSQEIKDPRTMFYLGNACRGLADSTIGSPFYAEAVSWYQEMLPKSGSREDRVNAFLNIAYHFILHHRPWKALDWVDVALKACNWDPRLYFAKARCYYDLKRYKDSLLWAQFGHDVGIPNYLTSVDPQSFDFHPMVFEALCYKELGKYDEAIRLVAALKQSRPNHSLAIGVYDEVTKAAEKSRAETSIKDVASMVSGPENLHKMFRTFRPEIRKTFPKLDIETATSRPNTKSIDFLCPTTVEAWDPDSFKTGVGGSERMVMQLASGFAKKGYHTTVYGSPQPKNFGKMIDGVIYKHVDTFNPLNMRDIVILWRNPLLLDQVTFNGVAGIRARKVYVDMHDVAQNAAFTPERVDKCSGFFFKSAFHRSPAKNCPDSKAIISRNAVDISTFPEPGDHANRNFKKIVWLSSADRGVIAALKTFDLVKRQPNMEDVEFHVYYGFTPLYTQIAAEDEYQFMGDMGYERHMLDYAEEAFDYASLLGAHMHGRVGNKEIIKSLSTAGVWLYPTLFPEISCISAMEAQLAGAFPICSNTGALKETVDFGTFIDPDSPKEAAAAVTAVINKGADHNVYRTEMQTWARTQFAFGPLIDQWAEEFQKT